MKPIAGLSLEYFVIGAVAGFWLVPWLVPVFSAFNFTEIPTNKDIITGVIIAFLIPSIYVAGMICDLIGYLVTSKLTHLKENLEHESWAKANKAWSEMKGLETTMHDSGSKKEKLCSAQLIYAYTSCYERGLAAGIEMRSTRDRISRGSMIACIPLIAVVPYSFGIGWIFIPILMFVAISTLWYRFQKLSASFDAYAWHVMNEKHCLDKKGVAQPITEEAPGKP
jgi:hypothetical protein